MWLFKSGKLRKDRTKALTINPVMLVRGRVSCWSPMLLTGTITGFHFCPHFEFKAQSGFSDKPIPIRLCQHGVCLKFPTELLKLSQILCLRFGHFHEQFCNTNLKGLRVYRWIQRVEKNAIGVKIIFFKKSFPILKLC